MLRNVFSRNTNEYYHETDEVSPTQGQTQTQEKIAKKGRNRSSNFNPFFSEFSWGGLWRWLVLIYLLLLTIFFFFFVGWVVIFRL